jgi:hypothetical protein
VHRFTHWPKATLAGCAGALAALGVATGLTQAAAQTTTTPASTVTTTTTTPPTTTTKTTTTPKAAPKPKATTKQITCKASLVATKPPVDSAESFGSVSCGVPLGKGVHHDTSSIARTSASAGTFTGRLKLFFNTGTVRGTYKMGFTVANKAVTYDGTLKISSGTGEFSGVTGTGTITGTSADGVRSSLTDKMTLKFPPKKTA